MRSSRMYAVLLLGLLVGVRHALEADHIAAVTALASRSTSLMQRIALAAAWGGGHAAGLTVLGAILISLDMTMPERIARALELAAAVVLVGVGADVLRRARRRRIHVHLHQHGDGGPHLHVHAHAGDGRHDAAAHDHVHVRKQWPRALAIGGLHGLAGSGLLVLLSVQSLGTGLWAFAYVVCFALGSILGMIAFSTALSLPLALSRRLVERAAGGFEVACGAVSIAIGCWMVVRAAA